MITIQEVLDIQFLFITLDQIRLKKEQEEKEHKKKEKAEAHLYTIIKVVKNDVPLLPFESVNSWSMLGF